MSLLCEGDFNPSRKHILRGLWNLGYGGGTLKGWTATGETYCLMTCKPVHLSGSTSILGRPV